MSKGATFLLSQGDKLRLCDGTTFIYHSNWVCEEPTPPQEVDELRDMERDVYSHHARAVLC